MHTTERIVLIVSLFGGFLWLRSRARSMDLSGRKEWVMAGIFLLVGLLMAEKWLFGKLPQGTALTMVVETATLIATFAAIGYGFLRPSPPGDGGSGSAGVPEDPGSRDSGGRV